MKTVIEMAQEAGGYFAELPNADAWLFDDEKLLASFVEIIRADEREAMVAEAAKKGWGMRNDDPFEDCVREIADIRARGNK